MTEFKTIINMIKPLDQKATDEARARQDILTKPQGSLGRLEELSIQLAGIQGTYIPKIKNKAIITMAADHGVVSEGTSAYPQEVTRQMVFNFLNGGAAINIIADHIGARLALVDMGVIGGFEPHPSLICKMIDFGTMNMTKGPAMSRKQAEDSIQAGIDVVETEISRGLDIVGTGDMGIGNTTASAAICAAVTGTDAIQVTGRGTGIDEMQLKQKAETINKALEINKPDTKDAIDILAKIGGFEIGGLAGVILGAAANRIPVVIDGFISGAAALIATELSPITKDYLIAAHLSVEVGHKIMLQHMGLKPLFDIGMRLGEGTGAALGISLAEVSTRILGEMATFGEAGVSERSQ